MTGPRPFRLGEAFTHARFVQDIYTDPRPTRLTRDLLLVIAYTLTVAPAPVDAKWDRIREHLERAEPGSAYRRYTLDDHIRDDAPRYEVPPEQSVPACVAALKRPRKPPPADNTTSSTVYRLVESRGPATEPDLWVCGVPTRSHSVTEIDSVTGEITVHWYCRKHRLQATQHAARVLEPNKSAPAPVPNRGGILPTYFTADWVEVYTHYCPGWKEPIHGVNADEWPSAAPEARPQRPKLTVIQGGLA